MKYILIVIFNLSLTNLLHSQEFSSLSNIESFFSLNKKDLNSKLTQNGYHFNPKNSSDKTSSYVKTSKDNRFEYVVNYSYKGNTLTSFMWEDDLAVGSIIVNNTRADYTFDETKSDNNLGVDYWKSLRKHLDIIIFKTIPYMQKGRIGFHLFNRPNGNIKTITKNNGSTTTKNALPNITKQEKDLPLAIKNEKTVEKDMNNKSEIIDDFIKDTIIVDKHDFLKSQFQDGVFINDSIISWKDNAIDIKNGRSIEFDVKTSVIKEYTYIDEKEDEERIKIILFSTNDNGMVRLDVCTLVENGKYGYRSIGRSKIIFIEKQKQSNVDFKTIKENGTTYFTANYTNENNNNTVDYYDISLSFVKKVIKNNKEKGENDFIKSNRQ